MPSTTSTSTSTAATATTTTAYVIGLDFGTDSVRCLIVDAHDGTEIATAAHSYARWADGMRYCDTANNQFRQHPQDYIDSMEHCVRDALAKAPAGTAALVKGISIATTGSTPVAVDRAGVPLALLPPGSGFEENPNAMFILWKDHTAVREAAEINELCARWETDYSRFEGGVYSSEWFWAKILRTIRIDEEVRAAAFSWVEHCDWIPFLLTGGQDVLRDMKRSRCAAGHKALWHASFGNDNDNDNDDGSQGRGLPTNEFFTTLDPLLDGYRDRMFADTYTSDSVVGTLTGEWAMRLGLSNLEGENSGSQSGSGSCSDGEKDGGRSTTSTSTSIVVGVGAIDAHVGAVGGQIEPYFLSKVMGTSTCDILVIPPPEAAATDEDNENGKREAEEEEEEKGADKRSDAYYHHHHDDTAKQQNENGDGDAKQQQHKRKHDHEHEHKLVRGICGQVDGSVIPGMLGLEAGQSAFGDVYAWFKEMLAYPVKTLIAESQLLSPELRRQLVEETLENIIPVLSRQAAEQVPIGGISGDGGGGGGGSFFGAGAAVPDVFVDIDSRHSGGGGNGSSSSSIQQHPSSSASATTSSSSSTAIPSGGGGGGVVALDWLNGRRTPDANQALKGAIMGLNLASDAPVVFRALVEATCFGARSIVERFQSEGVPIHGVIGLGGVAKKSPFVMQTMADVLNRPIKVAASEQTCALGAAMFAATVAGIHSDVSTAMEKMGAGFDTVYEPEPANVIQYNQLYQQYLKFGAAVETLS